MKIKAIIVDDESHARSFLRKLCHHLYEDTIEIVDECSCVETALSSIKRNEPNLVFLDIQMPLQNGLELLQYFDTISFEVIFTTAHKEYTLEAIRNSALDYLLKPISIQDLKLAISRLETALEKKQILNRYKLLNENLKNQSSEKQRIAFPTNEGFEVIQTNKIIFCKSNGSYTYLQTTDQSYYSSKSFKETCELLQAEKKFLKVQRSYLINCEYVKSFITETFDLEMVSGDKIPVSNKTFTKKEILDAVTK
ncbi:DNA-binding response regulator [Flavobacterium collinsii]|uniref:LytR/AlgR family response regulator transcription factor n=1 Tax=Flavobacterium collinsii TaxID=1114861 RepID=UPI0022CB8BC1|nr:LytTR family DNA-binding domain-containing protein [Flavobacterium collinsii]GIQ60786.1 DNA-binding response regulator [Flavobacterium collinsii]